MGAAVRDEYGQVRMAVHGASEYEDINCVEVNAMEEGIKMAVMLGCEKVIVQSDSRNAVEYVNSGEPPWKIRSLIKILHGS